MVTNKKYNLEDRAFVKSLKKTISNIEDGKQLIKSSGSVGANYIEANEKLGDKDFKYRLKIARKEVKEAQYWLRLLKEGNPESKDAKGLIQEAGNYKGFCLPLSINQLRICLLGLALGI